MLLLLLFQLSYHLCVIFLVKFTELLLHIQILCNVLNCGSFICIKILISCMLVYNVILHNISFHRLCVLMCLLQPYQ